MLKASVKGHIQLVSMLNSTVRSDLDQWWPIYWPRSSEGLFYMHIVAHGKSQMHAIFQAVERSK